jgi:uncharacterized lipoprotein YmbA
MYGFLFRQTFSSFVIAAVLLASCAQTQPARFYTLSIAPELETDASAANTGQGIALGVGPVTLPAYLDRPQIVTRKSSNRLELAEFDRWGEPLEDSFLRILAENLSYRLGTERVALYPWDRTTPIDFQVTVEVTRFDTKPNGDVFLAARWSIFQGDREKMLLVQDSTFSEPSASGNYEALVAAQSRALGRLSEEIADAIRELTR